MEPEQMQAAMKQMPPQPMPEQYGYKPAQQGISPVYKKP
jgi:hypothetical protein